MISKTLKRIPVIYKNKPLMSMKWNKCRRLLKEKRARLVKSKFGFYYLVLKFKPSGFNTQDVVLGIDPGSIFDSYSVVTKDFNIHFQTSFQTNRSDTNKIKKRSTKRRLNRRSRRSKRNRRHQKIRNENKSSRKLSNTIISKLMRMKWMIKSIIKFFPINKAVVEEVKSIFTVKSFTNVELGKTELKRFIMEDLHLPYVNSKSYTTTKTLRLKYFNNHDYKLQNKSKKSFYSHSIDSYVIALDNLNYNELEKLNSRFKHINKHTIFIEQVEWINKRELFRFKKKIKDNCKYFRYKTKGKIVYFDHFSKLKKIRVKVDNNTKSNHVNNWIYAYQNVNKDRDKFIFERNLKVFSYSSPTFKSFKSRYGGSVVNGNSRTKLPIGMSKYSLYDPNIKMTNGFKHYEIQIK